MSLYNFGPVIQPRLNNARNVPDNSQEISLLNSVGCKKSKRRQNGRMMQIGIKFIFYILIPVCYLLYAALHQNYLTNIVCTRILFFGLLERFSTLKFQNLKIWFDNTTIFLYCAIFRLKLRLKLNLKKYYIILKSK